ncbi:MAG TPA: UDP-glucose--hexose-1-phosphate uridylyltransferase [Candidatus Lambdaproteobacteria bacterium]|nr:UDP-glucose--hexose-1-phosphate uridylyltransferase [Candidatus Lambdaproteobacteria bacterium]
MTDFKHPHRRQNMLTGDWVLVSPQRTKRPWQGSITPPVNEKLSRYDPQCYLCPGNSRADGKLNPDYTGTYLFPNDFPALLPETELIESESPLFKIQPVSGICRVLCFSERHDLTLPELELSAIENIVHVWAEQVKELGEQYRWVQIFENKGEMMGCSNPHPHGQIWAGDFLPNEVIKEELRQRDYYQSHGSELLSEYVDLEMSRQERLVEVNEYWLSVVPWWAVWPFETMLLPKRHVACLSELSGEEQAALAELLKNLLSRYDNLFQTSFPYSMGWHGAPFSISSKISWRLHAHIFPPLLRSAGVRKFMVGYEMLAEAQRDLTAEHAASLLRECSTKHYSEKAE